MVVVMVINVIRHQNTPIYIKTTLPSERITKIELAGLHGRLNFNFTASYNFQFPEDWFILEYITNKYQR